jgi:glycosyltransferase involved in cell wall biosynthesis
MTIGRYILLHAQAIVSNSKASAQFVQKLSGRTDTQVIYRGVNIETIEKILTPCCTCSNVPGENYPCFLGRLIEGKGVADLIQAIAELEPKDVMTFIIGDGPERKSLEKQVKNSHLEKQVLFFGNLPFAQAISILKIAHIAINPSYTEGLPTVVTEAALCQKAIIATPRRRYERNHFRKKRWVSDTAKKYTGTQRKNYMT